MVSRSNQSLNASPSTSTSTSSQSTLFNSRQILSGQWYIPVKNSPLFDQSRGFLSTKSHWNCALSTTESPTVPPKFNSLTQTAKIIRTRSKVSASSLMANSKDHLHASEEMDIGCHLAWCIMAGQARKSMALASSNKVTNNMWIHWQRGVMWVDCNSTQGNGQMHSRMEKARYCCQMHAHSVGSLKRLKWSRGSSMNSNKMAQSLSSKLLTMLNLITRMR